MTLFIAAMVAVIALTGINTFQRWDTGLTLRGFAVRAVIIVWALVALILTSRSLIGGVE